MGAHTMIKALLLCGAMAGLVLDAGLANAQTEAGASAPTSIGEIIVTGSRIRRDPLVQSSPVVVID